MENENLLEVEELETVIAPKIAANHNETFLAPEAEELEPVIAPKIIGNHNETFL